MPIHIPPEAADAAPGLIGSLIATMRFTQGPIAMRGVMFLGGASLSYFAAPSVASMLGMKAAEGLVGFMLGVFGMAIAAKVYEGIAAFDMVALSKGVLDWALKRLGV